MIENQKALETVYADSTVFSNLRHNRDPCIFLINGTPTLSKRSAQVLLPASDNIDLNLVGSN